MLKDMDMFWFDVLHDAVHTSAYGRTCYPLPGVDLAEWRALHHHDYDDVDRLYVDHETIGGG